MNEFTIRALNVLEKVEGIQVLSQHERVRSAFETIQEGYCTTTGSDFDIWSLDSVQTNIKPTWKNLLLLLHILNLDHIAQLIETYFGVTVLVDQQPQATTSSITTSKES